MLLAFSPMRMALSSAVVLRGAAAEATFRLTPCGSTSRSSLVCRDAGWNQFPDIPTPRARMIYDPDELMVGGLISSEDEWTRLLDTSVELPGSYQVPRAIHLITEFATEPMIEDTRSLHERGVTFSLE